LLVTLLVLFVELDDEVVGVLPRKNASLAALVCFLFLIIKKYRKKKII
jgi:hypothetical protein